MSLKEDLQQADNRSGLTGFNLRVYGLWVNSRNQLLVTHERHKAVDEIFKFPGGGLEPGEGVSEGLAREFREELGLPVLRSRHFYTTDFFQRSYFRPHEQIISIYYRVWCPEAGSPQIASTEIDVLNLHWVPLSQLSPGMLTFPIDQHVVRLLLADTTQTEATGTP